MAKTVDSNTKSKAYDPTVFKPSELAEAIELFVFLNIKNAQEGKSRRGLMIWGPPGIGKSAIAAQVQVACATKYFRLYTNADVLGVELGGAAKNVIALAVGMASGMGLGDNAVASLITRGLAEIVRLGVSLGADPLSFSGLAGVGDLVVTCMSPLSRNRSFGELIGRGLSVAEAVAATKQTAEGVASSKSILDLARRYGIEMPITDCVERIIHEGASPREMIIELMSRGPRSESSL